MYKLFKLPIAVAFSVAIFIPLANAELTIEISEGYENAIPIAVVPFSFEAKSDAKSLVKPDYISHIISADLRRSGRFNPITKSELPAMPYEVSTIDFSQWRAIDVDNMVIGKLVEEGNGLYRVDVHFLDVLKKNQVFGQRWSHVPKASLRQVAHQISDLIYEELTGIKGAFNTQIAYIALRKIKGKYHYNLEVSDSDGYNPQSILKSDKPIMSPSWSPDGEQLAYVSFENGRSEVFVQSLDGSSRDNVAKFKGINGAPAWSPDGSKLAVTLSKDGSADIYIMDLKTKKLKRLTHKRSIETEATWSANGKSLFFSSDRRVQPQIFQVFLDTGETRRVTFVGKYNANPEVSPDGRYLTMVNNQGEFHIGRLDLYTNDFTVLTDTFLDESPSFSPNGEMILYALKHNGKGQLAVVSIDGKVSQRLKISDGQIREPAWGPYLTK